MMDNKTMTLARSVGLPVLAIAVALLMGCGQKGPLTLPKSAQAASAAKAAKAAKAASAASTPSAASAPLTRQP